ncbi:MAG: nitrite reductase small subunit NirD [Magnetococcales bacterium]|nr:nitrite reductase small subunit NirD [Magnetococcales bacterium]NGZ28815.1 nitrite reductase small subunit NirD [Magnetococcales bacterium]
MTTWHDIGSVQEIPVQGARLVKSSQFGDVAIFRTVSNRVYALADKCPHRQGPLSVGIVHGEKVTCPLHNWTLDLASGSATGADQGCARVFPLKVEGERLMLGLPTDHA